MAHQDILIAWLNDAYSMENALIQVLENHAKDAKDHPQVQSKIQEHLEVTRHHADRVKGRIQALGGDTSTIKSGLANIFGTVQGMSSGAAKDELVKNGISDYAAEQFEVASYRALIAGAQAIGDQETVRVCQENLREDEEMARWLEQNLPLTVQEFMQSQLASHGEGQSDFANA